MVGVKWCKILLVYCHQHHASSFITTHPFHPHTSPPHPTSQLHHTHPLNNTQSYNEPTILFAKRITGEEEVPDGVVGVVGSDAPDVLAHLSVRARNMHVLFAACYDEKPLKELQDMVGKTLNIATTAGGKLIVLVCDCVGV